MATDLDIIESLKEKLNVSYKSDNSGNVIQLNLSGNQLSELPLKVTQLQNLQWLDLRGNQLSELPVEITQLQNLQSLDLRGNRLSELLVEITQLNLEIHWEWKPSKGGILLEGNPLKTPPLEVVKRGKTAIIEYLKSLQGKKRRLNEVKVILHFEELALENTYVLEPKWITSAVYKIINAPQLAASKGILSFKDLEAILHPQHKTDYTYPRDKYPYVIEN
jgi:hypothetical protein